MYAIRKSPKRRTGLNKLRTNVTGLKNSKETYGVKKFRSLCSFQKSISQVAIARRRTASVIAAEPESIEIIAYDQGSYS